jgi:uncharacterized membrane protein YGL010W
MLVVLGVLIWLAELIAARGAAQGWTSFGVLFVGGWILQLVGHAFEGRKPALVGNLFQIFVAPIFLAAEVSFLLGFKAHFYRAVQSRASELRKNACVNRDGPRTSPASCVNKRGLSLFCRLSSSVRKAPSAPSS